MLKVSPVVAVSRDRIGNAGSQGLLAGFTLPPIQMRSDLRPGRNTSTCAKKPSSDLQVYLWVQPRRTPLARARGWTPLCGAVGRAD